MGAYGSYIQLAVGIGGLIYSLVSQKESENPEPQELQVNNYSRNLPVPIVYGTDKVTGTCIYIGNTKAEYVEAGGGKGGFMMIMGLFIGTGPQQQPGWYYSADFCIGLCEGSTYGINNIYLNDISLLDVLDQFSYDFEKGDNTQLINSTISDFLSDGSAIPWRHTSYIFLSGTLGQVNQIPSVSAEVIGLLSNSQYYNSAYSLLVFERTYGNPPVYTTYYVSFDSDVAVFAKIDNGTYRFYIAREYSGDDIVTFHTINILTDGQADNQCSFEGLQYGTDFFRYAWGSEGSYWNPYIGGVWSYLFSGADFAFHLGVIHQNEGGYSGGDIFTWSRHDPTTFRLQRMKAAGGTRYYWVESNGDLWTLDTHNPYNDYMSYDHMHSRDPGRPVTNETGFGWADYVFVGDRCQWNDSEWYSHGFVQSTTTWRCTPLILNPYGIDLSFTPATLGSVSQIYIYNYRFLYYIVYNNTEVFLYKWDIRTDEHKLLRKISDDCYGPCNPSYFYHCAWMDNGERTIDSFIKFRGAIYLMTFPWRDAYGVPHIYNTPNFKCYKIIPYTDTVIFLSNLVIKYSWYGYQPDQDPNHFNQTDGYNWAISDDKLYFVASGGTKVALYEIVVSPNTEKDASPIEVVYDFLTNERYGMGISASLIDGSPYVNANTSFWNENIYCYEAVTTESIGECRFLYSNTFDKFKKGFDIVQDILQTCRGFLYYCDGKIKVKIEKGTETPVIYFGCEEVSFLAKSYL